MLESLARTERAVAAAEAATEHLLIEMAEAVIAIGDLYLQMSSIEADSKHTVGGLVRLAIQVRDRFIAKIAQAAVATARDEALVRTG